MRSRVLFVRINPIVLTLALIAGGALPVGCGGGTEGSGTAGTGGGTAGTTGAAGTSGGGGTAGTLGTAGTGGDAGNGGATGRGGATAGIGGGGAGGAGAAIGRGGSTGGGAAGRGGSGGSAGSTGMAGTSGATGAAGAAGRGGNGGIAGGAGRGGASGAAGGAGRGGSSGAGGTAGMLTNPRIMPLGDSTTASVCYRAQLWQMLTQSGRTFQFIGSRNGDPGCNVSGYDRDNEGHGGYIVTDILKAAGTGTRPGGADAGDPYVSDARDLATWFDGRPADIVLMHFGTNDVWNNFTPANILNAYTAILNKLRTVSPNVRVMVAQIIPLQPSGCNDCPTRAQNLNAQIPAWATANSTAASPITVVDQFTGFNPAQDTSDGVHPNASGSTKIAAKWFSALSPMF
jgi:lysophospholipase L1-like esterase